MKPLKFLPERALIVKKKWLDMILSGEKGWEMRSRPTKIRGRIGLIESGSGLVVGEVDLYNCTKKLPDWVMYFSNKYHRTNGYEHEYRYAWELKNHFRYIKPIPYKHPQGAVIWVKLDGRV